MNSLTDKPLRTRRIGFLGVLLIVLTMPLDRAAAQALPLCSWPFEVTGRGLTNVFTPDTNATYWVMLLDMAHLKRIIIDGEYPEARFFNISSYEATGSLVDSIFDAEITPSVTNPFANPAAPSHKNYRLDIGRDAGQSTNHLQLGQSQLNLLVYRVYVPDHGRDRKGNADLPRVTLVAADGSRRSLLPCPFADSDINFSNLIVLLQSSGFANAISFLQEILAAGNGPRVGSCKPGEPAPAVVSFATPTSGTDFFINLQTTYLETPPLCFQMGKVLVVRGKALAFPDTFEGESVFHSAIEGEIQTRYWSMCNNEAELPFPVVACQADFATELGPDQFYTYIVSNDPAPPPWLPTDATWLPWGATDFLKNLIFRNILLGISLANTDYYPSGVFCSVDVIGQPGTSQQRWQRCRAAAGIATARVP